MASKVHPGFPTTIDTTTKGTRRVPLTARRRRGTEIVPSITLRRRPTRDVPDKTGEDSVMKKNLWLAGLSVAALSLAWAVPAAAEVVDFEDVAPTLFTDASIVSGSFRFTSDGFGFSGVDDASSFVFGQAPHNAGTSRFLFALNTDGLDMRTTNRDRFRLRSFDYAFVAPFAGLGSEGATPGELLVVGEKRGGGSVFASFGFPVANLDGDFGFGRLDLAGTDFDGVSLVSASFFGCIYVEGGSCSFVGDDVPPQFALDNISTFVVPEPGSAVLMFGALAGLYAARRRRVAR